MESHHLRYLWVKYPFENVAQENSHVVTSICITRIGLYINKLLVYYYVCHKDGSYYSTYTNSKELYTVS